MYNAPVSATATIHETAAVSPNVELGAGVTVGPYAVIEAGARIGDESNIAAHVVIKGATTLGSHCRVHSGAVLGDDPQDLGFESVPTRLVIGDHTTIREHATVHRSTNPEVPTRIGQNVLLMVNSHVAHDCVVGDHAILCNGALVAGHCSIGQQAFLSGNTVIHQFCRVGDLVMLSGLSGVGRDIGPYLMVAERSDVVGINVVGMRRSGMSPDARKRVKAAYRLLFQLSDLAQGLERIESLGAKHPEVRAILTFYKDSKRGFSRPPADHSFLA